MSRELLNSVRSPEAASKKDESFDLRVLANHSDGLIFFDFSGNFIGCDEKMERLAGSIDALREALESSPWPRDFASRGEPATSSARTILLPVRLPVEIRCVRTPERIVAAIILDRELRPVSKELLREIFSNQMCERRAISRHLHAGLAQDLVALSLSLSGLREESLTGVGEQGDSRLAEAIAQVNRCCRGVRALSYVLAPPSFLNAGLIETIRWYANVLRGDAGVDITVDAPALAADPPCEINELFLASLQQMAAAAIRQPRGARIRVVVAHEREMLSMTADYACDSSESVPESPLVRELAKALGGETRLIAGDGGIRLEISIPWRAPPGAAP